MVDNPAAEAAVALRIDRRPPAQQALVGGSP